jgi:hypothetical protein
MGRLLRFKARRLTMRSCLLLSGVTLSLAALAPPAGADWHRIEFPGKGELGVIGGKVWVVSAPEEPCTWHLIRGAQAGHIQVLDPQEWKGRRLAYDPEGKDKAVFLDKGLAPGTKWKITYVEGEQEPDYTIQAAEGKLKGWYLDVAEKPEKITDAKGRRSTTYRVFLSQEPKRLPNVLLTLIAP